MCGHRLKSFFKITLHIIKGGMRECVSGVTFIRLGRVRGCTKRDSRRWTALGKAIKNSEAKM